MRRPRRPSAVQAGLITLVVVAAGLYAMTSPRLPGDSATELRAVFATSNELARKAPVRIAGIDVGEVAKVERGPGEAATVTLRLEDRGLPVHADATAQIRPRIVLEGNFFVDLQPGTPGAPQLGGGDVIPLGQTSVPVQLDQVLSALDGATRSRMRTLVQEYATALDRGGAQAVRASLREAPGAFAGVASSARSLRGAAPDDLRVALRDSGRLTAALADREAELRRLLAAYERTVRTLAEGQGRLSATVSAAAPLVRAVPRQARRIDALLPELARAGRRLRPALVQLPAATRDLVPALDQLEALLGRSEARGLAQDLRPALRSLRRAMPGLRTLLGRVQLVSACTSDVVLPTLRAEVPDGSLSNGQPVWQELLHLATSLASASQNFDGNGPSARFHAGYGEGMYSLGDHPTVGERLATQAFAGSRPAWLGPGKDPPFRPEAPCTDERPPSLHADTLTAPAQRRVQVTPTKDLLRASRRALRALTRRGAR